MTTYRILFVATIALLTATIGGPAAAQTAQAEVDKAHVTEAVRSMFAAFAADDPAKFRAVTTPDFYAFDVGKRFTGDALMDLIKTVHAEGKVYVWTINEPEVHVHGDVAWITYVNKGSVKDASGTKEVTWLESAVLEKEKGVWRIHFLHSTRVPYED
jgi:ketosteroid isomerase-like protein